MRRIEVLEHREQWANDFESEAQKLKSVFGQVLLAIHHVGSTSVPGLPAKPTIDVLCVVKPETQVEDYYQAMIGLGYEARGECLDATIPGTPGRFYFPKVIDSQHVTHVHVCQEGHAEIKDLIILRDYLREHPDAAKAYGQLKTQLADTVNNDNIAYMRGKDKKIKDLISQAHAWGEAR